MKKREGMKNAFSLKAIGRLLRYGKDMAVPFFVAMLFAASSGVLAVIGPSYLGEITDLASDGLKAELLGTGSIDLDALTRIGTLLIFIYSGNALCNYLERLIMTLLSAKLLKRLRADLAKKVNRVPLLYLDGCETGDLMSLISNDADAISETLGNSVMSMFGGLIRVIGVLIMMMITSWQMSLIAVGSTLLGLILAMVLMVFSQRFFNERQALLGEMNGHVEENFTNHAVIRSNNAGRKNKTAFERLNDALYKTNWKSEAIGGVMGPLMNFVSKLGYVAVCVSGAVLAKQGTITFGVIASFIFYVNIFSQQISSIAQNVPNAQRCSAASSRIFLFLDQEEVHEESAELVKLENVKGDVSFKNVRFSYVEGQEVIHGFSAEIKAGSKVAIVGPTGAGKTTMVNLLMRFYDLDSGTIEIDGVPTTAMRREDVHALFGMVLQDTWLFGGTIRANLKFNHPDLSDEVMKGAAKRCGVDHFIKALPHGYHTVLDDKLEISAGQKQLLTITRAMIQNAPMLILDEATSSVDTRTEIEIQNAMDELTKGRTSFIIAHRLSTIRNADLILVMKDGDIVEMGNHASLLRQNGFYASLYNAQFENETN